MNVESIKRYMNEVSLKYGEIKGLERKLKCLEQFCSSINPNNDNDSPQMVKINEKINIMNAFLIKKGASISDIDYFKKILF